MKASDYRLTGLIIGTVLLPILIYLIYELSAVREDEKVIEKVYNEQLDAILFSVNQFSNDNISALLNKIQYDLSDSLQVEPKSPYLDFSNFYVLILRSEDGLQRQAVAIQEAGEDSEFWYSFQDSLLNLSPELSEKLLRYREGGYQKIEPAVSLKVSGTDVQVIHAVVQKGKENILVTGLINIDGFANNVLAPKLQEIADQELIITLGYRDAPNFIYMTDSLSREVSLTKNMWLFPTIDVGISTRGKTVKELAAERTFFNLTAIGVLTLLLFFGFVLIVRNLRREMQLAQTKSDFVSNVSHELRTPLSLISMFAETLMLDRVSDPKKRKEYEEIIFKETNRLTNIVNKILNFSRIEANKRTYHPVPTHINKVVEDLMHDYSFHLEKNGFTHAMKLTDNLPEVSVDGEALYEALVNLIDNAIKYSPEEKHLLISTGMKNDQVFVEVEDSGLGISSEKIQHIFEKFYRVESKDVQTTRGAGLGLALVNHIIEAHNGDIEVESTPKKGSIFRLLFHPLKP